MAKSKTPKKIRKKKDLLKRDYANITQGYKGSLFQSQPQEWKSPNDFFVKFSLYRQTSTSIPSTNTSLLTQQ